MLTRAEHPPKKRSWIPNLPEFRKRKENTTQFSVNKKRRMENERRVGTESKLGGLHGDSIGNGMFGSGGCCSSDRSDDGHSTIRSQDRCYIMTIVTMLMSSSGRSRRWIGSRWSERCRQIDWLDGGGGRIRCGGGWLNCSIGYRLTFGIRQDDSTGIGNGGRWWAGGVGYSIGIRRGNDFLSANFDEVMTV